MSQTVKSNDNRVYRLVLTGGPCGGKTTGQARLCTFFESIGWKVYRVPATSTVLAGAGVKSDISKLSDDILVQFYGNLLKMVMQIEQTYFDLASTCVENCLVVCDGGTMDLRANLTDEQWLRVMSDAGWNDVELRDSRYNQTVHMVSVANATNGRRRHFSSHTSMDMETARQRDLMVSQAWVGHPYYDVIDNSTDFDRKLMRMIAAVCDRLDIHIGDRLATDSYKRKFLIRKLPDISLFPQFQDFTVVHDYLVTPNSKMQARIRRRGQNANWTYTHTIRCPQVTAADNTGRDSAASPVANDNGKDPAVSCETPELKMQVSAREYELLLAQKDSSHHTVYKTRRCFLCDNQYFQMDIYEEPCPNRCRGLILLETYTSMKGDDFEVPGFLGVVKEVTGDPAYSMYNLSKKDEPEEVAEKLSEKVVKKEPAVPVKLHMVRVNYSAADERKNGMVDKGQEPFASTVWSKSDLGENERWKTRPVERTSLTSTECCKVFEDKGSEGGGVISPLASCENRRCAAWAPTCAKGRNEAVMFEQVNINHHRQLEQLRRCPAGDVSLNFC
jgi:CYTH domain-containing protein